MPELTTYQHVYRKEEHCKIITVFALTLTLGALSLSQGPCERGSTSNTAKKEEKKRKKRKKKKRREILNYVYWTYCIPTYKTFL